MTTHASQTSENKTSSAVPSESKKQIKTAGAFQLIDNRPAAVTQRKLQEMANKSPQSQQTAQLQRLADSQIRLPIQKKENITGLPDQLKSDIENLSGYSMDDVRVHLNSAQPAQLQADAFSQGTDIHLASGQEKHLPHEAWHVVQQKQSRVKPTIQLKGKVSSNDDAGLEKEADVMGERAIKTNPKERKSSASADAVAQKKSNLDQSAGSRISPPITNTHTNLGEKVKTSSPLSGVIQAKGSGGQKIGFDLVNDDKTNQKLTEGIALLQTSWAQAKAIRKKAKLDWMEQNIEGKKFSKPGSATTEYAKSLDALPEESQMLLETAAFKDKRLTLKEPNKAISYTYKDADSDASVQIGILKLGNEAYTESATKDDVAAREVYDKHGFSGEKTSGGNAKEYIKDSNNVETRRYAYVEKNYFQMMDFLKTGKMTGRFQQNMKAAGVNKGAETPTKGVKSKVLKDQNPGPKQLSKEQIAVAHQEMGSSPEQRGVSLTSTEKVGGTVGNAGENFRTEDGFRLKIDLARVPKDILLLNHYAEKGLISHNFDKAGIKKVTGNTNPGKTTDYKFGGSVRKNRELYLDHVKPEWVVEIEHHKKGGYDTSQAQESIIDPNVESDIMNQYYKFWEGFDAVLTGAKTDALTTEAAKKGISSAKLVKEGFDDGHKIKPYVTAVQAHEEVAGAALKGKFAQYHVGYVRGRVGKEMFKDSVEYAKTMK